MFHRNKAAVVCSILLSLITIRGFRYTPTEDGLVLAGTPVFLKVLLPLILIPILYLSFRDPDRRLKAHAGAFGAIAGLFYSLGLSMDRAKTLSWIWENRGYALNFLNIFLTWAILCYCFAYAVSVLLRKTGSRTAGRAASAFSCKRMLLWWGLLLAAFLPWFLYFYPGILTQDTEDMIQQALALRPLNDHHSVLITLVLRLIINLTGSARAGVSIYLLLQMALAAFIFGFCFERIRGYVRSTVLRCIAFLWFAVWIINPMYSVTLWKDVPFSLCFTGLMLCVNSIAEDEKAFFSSRLKQTALFAALALLPVLRHNGIAVTLLIFLYMLIRIRPFRRQIALICGGALLLFGLWSRVLLPALHVETVESSLGLGVFQQQIARTFAHHLDEIPAEDREILESYFDITEIGVRYNPIISDPVKKHFRDEVYESDPLRFFRAWLRLGLRYPLDYIEAFLHNNYGYWFPYPKDRLPYGSGIYVIESVDGLRPEPILKSGFIDRIYNWYLQQQRDPDISSLLLSCGLCFWLWLFSAVYSLYRKSRKFMLFIPGLALWLTVLISPVFNEIRYVYGLFAALPLMLASSLFFSGL